MGLLGYLQYNYIWNTGLNACLLYLVHQNAESSHRYRILYGKLYYSISKEIILAIFFDFNKHYNNVLHSLFDNVGWNNNYQYASLHNYTVISVG